jgi:amino acid adenylation domain-containing protein
MSARGPKVTPTFPTLVDALRRTLERDPEHEIYTYTSDGETRDASFTRASLDRRARAIAAELQAASALGERAVLLYPPEPDYVAGFLGCLYAGVIAVPAYPPDPTRLHRTLPRLQAIIADSTASVVLTTSPIVSMAEMLFDQAPELRAKRWIATDAIAPGREETYRRFDPTGDTIAFLQYTSGSTGTPKGVVLTHENLVHNEALISHAMSLDAASVVASWLPPYHDMGLIGGILAALYNGARTCLLSPMTFLQRPLRWLKAISTFGATVSGGPNFAYDLCIRKIAPEQRASLDLSRWRVAFSGAEPVRAETLDRFAEAFGPSGFSRDAFFPCYGLAEATLIVSGGLVSAPPLVRHVDAAALERARVSLVDEGVEGARAVVGCGTSLLDQDVVIADPETLAPASPGVVGEIWVRGGSVAQGYWQRPKETAETFGARLAGTGEGPYLRTGDLGYFDGDELFVAGRAKDLIIVRGKNYYPQDLERTAEESHPALRRGCAAAFSQDDGDEARLVLAIEVERGFDASGPDAEAAYAAIRRAVAEGHDLFVERVVLLRPVSIPKTSSGKIQRRETRAALAAGVLEIVGESVVAPPTKAGAFVAPRTPLEEALAAIFAEVLGEPRVSVHDDFFDLGGHSLLATQAVTRAREALGLPLTLRELFEARTVAALAEQVEALRASGGGAVEAKVPRAGDAERRRPSFAEERLWFLDQLEPGNVAYHVPLALRLRGPLDRGGLTQALAAVVRRHEALRTTFRADDGRPARVVTDEVPVAIALDEAPGLSPADREARLAAAAIAEARAPFDLARGPLFRARLLAFDDADHALFVTLHHVITDGWSMALLVRELEAYYALATGVPGASAPADLPVHVADCAAHQRDLLRGDELERLLQRWRKELEGAPEALDLPSDRARPALQTYRGAREPVTLPSELHAALRALSRRAGATTFMTLLAGFTALLARWSGQDDVVVGTPVAGRARRESEGLIGLFMNTLPLRVRLGDDVSFEGLVARAREAALFAYAHQDLPFERLAQEVAEGRDTSRSPVFQGMLILQNMPMPASRVGALELRAVPVHTGTSKLDLTLELAEDDGALRGFFEYNVDLFDAATIRQMAASLTTLLEAACAAPERRAAELPLLDEPARRRALEAGNDTAADYPRDALVHELFEAEVDRAPGAVAVVFEGEALSYRELDARANRLARLLRARGVGPDDRVGVLLERSARLVVALLAIAKAGGAYVPLDPSYPRDRLAYVLEDARARALVTEGALAEGLPVGDADVVRLDADAAAIDREGAARLARAATPGHLVYTIYTSGSTGRPKGVSIPHRALVNFVRSIAREPGCRPSDRLLAVTSLSFDIAGLELFVPLTTGASVEIASRETAADGALLRDRLATGSITILQATPATWQMLLDAGWAGTPGLVMLSGGEALPRPLAEALVTRGAALWNMYGPTETTIWSTLHRLSAADPAPLLGHPLANTRAYVVDARLEPVPPGVRGELLLGGDGVARGYLDRPELTAERFLADPFAPGGRVYRTGDLVRRRVSGELEFFGRLDHQVKLRGFRIELGEIESVLARHAGVREVVVVADGEGTKKRLVAYVAPPAGAPEPAAAELRAHLRATLPEHMVPSAFVALAALPRTPNGKIDRKRLPAPPRPEPGGHDATAPRGEVEEALAAIFRDVLNLHDVSTTADFFELGGHSLLATQALSRVRASLGVELPVRALFEAPTIAGLAERVTAARARAPEGAGGPPLRRLPREGALPTSFAQERMWFLDQIERNNPFYNVSAALRLRGALDVGALERALTAMVERHEPLRTALVDEGGRPVQVVKPPWPVRLTPIELAGGEAAVREEAHARAQQPFDLARGDVVRLALLRLAADDHVLLLTMHHAVSDEWSRGVLLAEIGALYGAAAAGQPLALPDLAVTYADYARWQRALLSGARLDEQLAYWRARLAGTPRAFDLPGDRPRPDTPSFRGGRVPVALTEAARGLADLARHEGATLYMALLAAFDVLLQRHTGQDDVPVGTPIANRARPELEALIGYFANTIVLRADLGGDPTFRELVARVRDTCLAAYAHQDVPFERVVEEVLPERDPSRTPLFQVIFVLQNAPATPPSPPGLALSWLPVDPGISRFDLGLELAATARGVEGAFEYASDLFDRATVERLARRFEVLAADAAERPDVPLSKLVMVGDAEREEILAATAGGPKKRLPAHLRALLDRGGRGGRGRKT